MTHVCVVYLSYSDVYYFVNIYSIYNLKSYQHSHASTIITGIDQTTAKTSSITVRCIFSY